MGVRGLFTYCKKILRHAQVRPGCSLEGKRIGMDGFNILYLFKERTEDLEAYLRGLLDLQLKITVYMDSRAAKEKEEVVEKRQAVRAAAKEKVADLEKFTQSDEFKELEPAQQALLEKKLAQTVAKAWSLTSKHTRWFKKLCADLGIELLWAEQEADEALAAGGYDIVITTDSDLVILGVPIVWIPRAIGLQHNEIRLQDFLQFVGLRQDQLLELAFLAGCDVYPRSIKPFGEAVSWLRFYGSLEAAHKRKPAVITAQHLADFARLRSSVWAGAGAAAGATQQTPQHQPPLPAQVQ